jgi:hypothetical protein
VVNYYCEVIVKNGVYPPGVYTFEIHPMDMVRHKHHNLIQMSHWVWKETEEGVFWLKNRTRATPDKLRPDEFGEFMWAKLKAIEFKEKVN